MDLQFIVGKLREDPFNLIIRAVDFDGKTPDEHLQVVNDVLSSLDADIKADVRIEPRDDVVERMLQFLLIHKCQLVPSSEIERLEWIDGIRNGQKRTLFPILHWVLSDYENLRKRTYLSRYLIPIDVPSEYLMQNNGNIEELLDAYKEMQAEFVESHKQYELVTANLDRPTSDIKNGIKQMEVEEQQLLDRLQREHAQTINNPIFERLLVDASNMRKQQDREIILDEQKREQLQSLAANKQLENQTRRMLDIIVSCEAKPSESILTELEHESQKSVGHLESNVMQKRHVVELVLLQAEKESFIDKTEDDVEYLMEMSAQLEDMLTKKRGELKKLGNPVGKLSTLTGLKQDLDNELAKLQTLRGDIDTKTMEIELLLSTKRELRDSIHALEGDGIQRPDGTSMKIHEFAEFKEHVDSSWKTSIVSKQEIAKVQDDILKLKQTEETLKINYQDLQAHFQHEEERAGVAGFQDINAQLEERGKQTTSLNELKSQALDDISAMVETIAHTLQGKKEELEPKVEELKQRRKEFQELQEKHIREKERYDEAAAKLTSGNGGLESDCSRLQEVWLEKERSYHLLCAKYEMATPKIGKVTELGRLKELYESTIIEQQEMAKELRAQQESGVNQSEDYISKQKMMFSNLKRLLELQAKVQ